MSRTDLHKHLREMGAEIDEIMAAHKAGLRARERGHRALRQALDRAARLTILNEKIEKHVAELARRDGQS